MFSLTLRTKREAKLPKAARHSCGGSLRATRTSSGQIAGQLRVRGWYRGPEALAASSSHVVPGTNDCFAIGRGTAIANGVAFALQNPGALS